MKLLKITALTICLNIPMAHAMNNDSCPLEQNSMCRFAGAVITALGCGMGAAAVHLYRQANTEDGKNSAATIVILSAKLAHLGVKTYSQCDNN